MTGRKIAGPESHDDITPEQEAKIESMIEQAEADIAQMRAEQRWGPSEGSTPVENPATGTRVNMRWPRTQLEIVRRAAELYGMPYQTYVKQAALRQALEDLKNIETVTGTQRPADERRSA